MISTEPSFLNDSTKELSVQPAGVLDEVLGWRSDKSVSHSLRTGTAEVLCANGCDLMEELQTHGERDFCEM